MRVAALLLSGLLLVGCDLFGTDDMSASLPAGPVVVASVGGDADGIWVFDPKTLEPTSVVETENRTPIGVVSSLDHERWYTAWSTGSTLDGDARNVRAILDPAVRRITERASAPTRRLFDDPLLYEPVNDHLVVSKVGDTTQFYDAETLDLVRKQVLGHVAAATFAPGREKVYFGVDTEDGPKVRIYDPAEAATMRTISLPDDLPVSDVALSPDERYLFATTWSRRFGPPGRFYMVDLEGGEVLFAGQVGSYAELAVAPDGRHVFIDCPAGGILEHTPTNQVLRFDTQRRELEVFINGGEALGLGYEGLIADKIRMLPSGEAFVMRLPVTARTRLDDDEQARPELIKVDTETAEVLATYTPERDEKGDVENYILHLGTATIPEP